MGRIKIKVNMEIAVLLSSIYGEDCQIGQIRSQSKRRALDIISKLIADSTRDIEIIGDPKVRIIMLEEE